MGGSLRLKWGSTPLALTDGPSLEDPRGRKLALGEEKQNIVLLRWQGKFVLPDFFSFMGKISSP